MNPSDFAFGFRILGSCHEQRRLIDWSQAFHAYAACDERAEVEREAYLSAFTFAADFGEHLKRTGSTAGFAGAAWAPWIAFDIDKAGDPIGALDATRRLLTLLAERFGADDDCVLTFFSGNKGHHVLLNTSLWAPAPSAEFHHTAKRFALNVAERAGIVIDGGTYAKPQALRAPNSRHAKTGRHKRRFSFDETMRMSAERIAELATHPEAFDVPTPTATSSAAAADWAAAAEAVATEAAAKAERFTSGAVRDKLNRLTFDFIAGDVGKGDRHRLLYSAAANLAELGAPLPLAFALLETSALDCGLPPSDVRRGIENGWGSVQGRSAEVVNTGRDGAA